MRLPPYPKYKPSGVEWLCEVPAHWGVRPLKYALSAIVSGGTPEVSNESYWADTDEPGHNWVAIADMTRDPRVRVTDRRITEMGRASKGLRVAPPGTLLYSMYASLGKVAVLEVPAAFNQAILALLPNTTRLNQGYLSFWLNSMEERLELFSSSNTQDNLNAAKVRSMPLFVPEPAEQRAIADFLDRETAKIDTLVAKKRTLIERLKEKRTALISRTVTRGLPPDAARAAGLDPHPKLKPSGIDWLGDVPGHWEIGKFSREVRIAEGQADPEIEPYASMVLVAPNHIESGTGRLLAKETAAGQGAISGKYLCRAGEVIYSKIRPALAKAVLAPEDCLCSADMYPM